jgi:ribose-phosphate pyrophosphokinase
MKEKFEVWNKLGDSIALDIGRFPGGEMRVRIIDTCIFSECSINAVLTSSDDVMTLIMLVDALRNAGAEKIYLIMPYTPYARQDRVCNAGEALSIRAFSKIINSLNFAEVLVWDAHSDVSVALIDRCKNISRSVLLKNCAGFVNSLLSNTQTPWYLLSPDACSIKKSYDIAKAFPEFKGIIFADKVRETSTGKIIATNIQNCPADIKDAKVLVCDDLCDGGFTFVQIANWFSDQKEDLTPKELNLFVTHGIFSKGLEVLQKPGTPKEEYRRKHLDRKPNTGLFDNIWCSLNFLDYK